MNLLYALVLKIFFSFVCTNVLFFFRYSARIFKIFVSVTHCMLYLIYFLISMQDIANIIGLIAPTTSNLIVCDAVLLLDIYVENLAAFDVVLLVFFC